MGGAGDGGTDSRHIVKREYPLACLPPHTCNAPTALQKCFAQTRSGVSHAKNEHFLSHIVPK